jgi:hypothetical protein
MIQTLSKLSLEHLSRRTPKVLHKLLNKIAKNRVSLILLTDWPMKNLMLFKIMSLTKLHVLLSTYKKP